MLTLVRMSGFVVRIIRLYLLLFVAKWDDMETYANMIPRDTYDSSFYRSVIAIHADEYQKAQEVTFFEVTRMLPVAVE